MRHNLPDHDPAIRCHGPARSHWLLLTVFVAAAREVCLVTRTGGDCPRHVRLVAYLHPQAAGRVYAAYGGMYISVALVWLWLVEGIRPDRWDLLGVALVLAGMSVIMFAPRT